LQTASLGDWGFKVKVSLNAMVPHFSMGYVLLEERKSTTWLASLSQALKLYEVSPPFWDIPHYLFSSSEGCSILRHGFLYLYFEIGRKKSGLRGGRRTPWKQICMNASRAETGDAAGQGSNNIKRKAGGGTVTLKQYL